MKVALPGIPYPAPKVINIKFDTLIAELLSFVVVFQRGPGSNVGHSTTRMIPSEEGLEYVLLAVTATVLVSIARADSLLNRK